MTYNESTKKAHYKWRANNIEQYRGYVNKGAKKYYLEHRQESNEKALKRYYLKKELEIFRRILVD
jgi:hypothetical protein